KLTSPSTATTPRDRFAPPRSPIDSASCGHKAPRSAIFSAGSGRSRPSPDSVLPLGTRRRGGTDTGRRGDTETVSAALSPRVLVSPCPRVLVPRRRVAYEADPSVGVVGHRHAEEEADRAVEPTAEQDVAAEKLAQRLPDERA